MKHAILNLVIGCQFIMINILLKCVNLLKVHLKVVILIENKKMIHFVSQQYKSYNILKRLVI